MRDAALKKARTVRDDVLHKLEQIARGNGEDVAALEALDDDTRHDALASGPGKLAARADAVLARAAKDETTAALVAGAELASDDAGAARASQSAPGQVDSAGSPPA